MKHTFAIVALSAALIAFGATTATAQSTYTEIEAGYQWVDVDGNEDLIDSS